MASRHFGCGRCGSRATRGRVEVARGLKKPFIFVTNDGQRAQRHHKKARHARARPAGARAGGGAGSVARGASSCLNGRGRTRGRSASWWLVPPSTRPPTSAAWELPRARADADETRTRAARVCVLDSSVARTARYHHPNVGRVGEAFAFGFSAGRGRGRAERAPAGTRGHYVETP